MTIFKDLTENNFSAMFDNPASYLGPQTKNDITLMAALKQPENVKVKKYADLVN